MKKALKTIPHFPHVRTIQKYDDVLATNYKEKLLDKLNEEREYFKQLKDAKEKFHALESRNDVEAYVAREEFKSILSIAPRAVSTFWDNVNFRSGRKHERIGDQYSDTNQDLMTSLHVTDRI